MVNKALLVVDDDEAVLLVLVLFVCKRCASSFVVFLPSRFSSSRQPREATRAGFKED